MSAPSAAPAVRGKRGREDELSAPPLQHSRDDGSSRDMKRSRDGDDAAARPSDIRVQRDNDARDFRDAPTRDMRDVKQQQPYSGSRSGSLPSGVSSRGGDQRPGPPDSRDNRDFRESGRDSSRVGDVRGTEVPNSRDGGRGNVQDQSRDTNRGNGPDSRPGNSSGGNDRRGPSNRGPQITPESR
jgi:hypothetical protein